MKIERALSRASLHFVLVLCCSLCFFSFGKVAEPQAPFIRIPEAVKDLTAAQPRDNNLHPWTNPSHNIDGPTAVDPANIRMQQGGGPLLTPKAGEAGKPQSHSIPLVPGSNATR